MPIDHLEASVSELIADRESDVYLVGRRNSPHVQGLRDLLTGNRIAFGWVDLESGDDYRTTCARLKKQK